MPFILNALKNSDEQALAIINSIIKSFKTN